MVMVIEVLKKRKSGITFNKQPNLTDCIAFYSLVIEPVLLKISIAPEYLNEYNVCFLLKCA